MEIKVNVKHMGKRRNSVEAKSYEIEGTPVTVRDLILAVVEAGVREYHKRMDEQESGELLKCLTKHEIQNQAESGKVSFGVIYGEKRADLKQAQENAIQCFEDGIYRIFLDDRSLEELNEKLCAEQDEQDGDPGGINGTFTFVRLTMLSGRMW